MGTLPETTPAAADYLMGQSVEFVDGPMKGFRGMVVGRQFCGRDDGLIVQIHAHARLILRHAGRDELDWDHERGEIAWDCPADHVRPISGGPRR